MPPSLSTQGRPKFPAVFKNLSRRLTRSHRTKVSYIPKNRSVPMTRTESSLRILNYNTLYGVYEGGNLLREVSVFLGVVHRVQNLGDIDWIRRESRYENTILRIVRESKADIVVLNEIVFDIPTPNYLGNVLTDMGYSTVFRGIAPHSFRKKSGVSIPSGMIIACRLPAEILDIDLGYNERSIGCSGGYGVYIPTINTTVIGVHLSLRSKARQMGQRRRLSDTVAYEQSLGRHVIVTGDFNQDPWKIRHDLGPLGLAVVTARSCPAIPWLPPMRCLDQCWIDDAWMGTGQYMVRSHSDHYAQIVDLTPKV